MTKSRPRTTSNQRQKINMKENPTMEQHQMIEVAARAVQLYAETHPRPPQVTQKMAAEMLGLSAPTVKKLINNGSIKLNKAGLIPITEIDNYTKA